jgi:hypothetical protein
MWLCPKHHGILHARVREEMCRLAGVTCEPDMGGFRNEVEFAPRRVSVRRLLWVC